MGSGGTYQLCGLYNCEKMPFFNRLVEGWLDVSISMNIVKNIRISAPPSDLVPRLPSLFRL